MMRSVGISVALAVAAVCCALAATGASGAIPSGVTIHVKHINTQSGRLYGYVFSQRPNRCANHRSVGVFKQRGASPHPRTDVRVAYNVPRKIGDRYKWQTTSPRKRIRVGKRYYARIKKEHGCQSDTSRTVRV